MSETNIKIKLELAKYTKILESIDQLGVALCRNEFCFPVEDQERIETLKAIVLLEKLVDAQVEELMEMQEQEKAGVL